MIDIHFNSVFIKKFNEVYAVALEIDVVNVIIFKNSFIVGISRFLINVLVFVIDDSAFFV